MRITESQLRRVVRRIVKEAFNRKVEDAIAKYSSPEGYRTWERMARGDFEMMAMGQDPDGIRSQYYRDWEDADFQAVLDAVG